MPCLSCLVDHLDGGQCIDMNQSNKNGLINQSKESNRDGQIEEKDRSRLGQKETFLERRTHRIAAREAEILTKSRIRGDGIHWRDAHMEFTKGKISLVENEDQLCLDKTWEDVPLDEDRIAAAKKILISQFISHQALPNNLSEQYIEETSHRWESFYVEKKDKFFKDRHYLGRKFFELKNQHLSDSCTTLHSSQVLELGCGVGNSLFPLIELNPNSFFFACDCSPKAIELLKKDPRYNTTNMHAFVCDIARTSISIHDIQPEFLDFVTMIFMLSAVAPTQMDNVVQRVNQVLKVDGIICFRDYGIYDMTQMRFHAKQDSNQLSENCYRRSDGTLSYFFSLDILKALFERNGFITLESEYETRMLINRKRKIRMYRIWVVAKFKKLTNEVSA